MLLFQERIQLNERLSQLETQLSEHEVLAKNYAKVRAENASLIRLLANFARKEYDIPPQSSRRGLASPRGGGGSVGNGVGGGGGVNITSADSSETSHHSVSVPPSSVSTPRNSISDFSNSNNELSRTNLKR